MVLRHLSHAGVAGRATAPRLQRYGRRSLVSSRSVIPTSVRRWREKLAALHRIHLARETLRQWMIAAGLWKDRRARLKPVHQPRHRRDCMGELIQIDGSEHWWFEGRGPQCTLLVYIDDASSRLMHLQFVESESTFDYFAATRAYLERHGKPVAFYSDKHGVFRVNKKDATGGDGMTQFGGALHALNIDIICATSSQARGRVERANGTLQDRLVKEMRLSSIDNIEGGSAFLPAFMEKSNARFAKAPLADRDLHRLLASHEDIDDAFAWKEERSVSVNLMLQYDQVLFILEPTGIARSLARKRVMVLAEDSMPEMARNLRAIRLFVWCSRIVETEPGLKRF